MASRSWNGYRMMMTSSPEFDPGGSGESQPSVNLRTIDSSSIGSVGLGMAGSIQDVVTALIGLRSDVSRITPQIEGMLSGLNRALAIVGGIDDPNARNAESSIGTAQTALREALSSWFADYLHRNTDLCQRLSA